MTLRGGGREQLAYWNSLSKGQQDGSYQMLVGADERANHKAYVSEKPVQMTISADQLKAWQAMSTDEQ